MMQTGRKMYHLVGGLMLLSVFYILGRERAMVFYVVFFAFALALDGARLMIPAWNRFAFEHFGSYIRRNEEHKLTGTTAYILGIGLSLYVYSPPVATAAICFLAIGDVAATTIGERYGKTKIGGKSLEGTIAFVVAALCAGFALSLAEVHLAVWIIGIGALVAASAELLPLPLNDNFVIPLVSGGVMELASRMAG